MRFLLSVFIFFVFVGLAHAQQDELELLNEQATKFYNEGSYDKAIPIAKSYSEKIKEKLGEDNPRYFSALNSLAANYFAQGRYDEVEQLLQKIIEKQEKSFGSEHPAVGETLNNLAALYYAQADYDKAEGLYKRSLALTERVFGPDHPNVAIILGNLASLYNAQGDYDKAEWLYNRSLVLAEKAFGPEHPNIAIKLNNMAELLSSQGRYDKAEALYKRSLAINEKLLGPVHPNTSVILSNLASLYSAQGKYDKAEVLYKRSLAINEKALGPEHPGAATSLNNLARLYQSEGKYSKAEELYKRSLAINKKIFGPTHRIVAKSLNDLAGLYRLQKLNEKSEQLLKQAEAIPNVHIPKIRVFYATNRVSKSIKSILSYGSKRSVNVSLGLVNVIAGDADINLRKHRFIVQGDSKKTPENAKATLQLTKVSSLVIRKVDSFTTENLFFESIKGDFKKINGDENQVLLFVHGYNVSFDEAVKRAAQISRDLKFNGSIILFSWPSASRLFGYGYDRASAEIAVNHLLELIEHVATIMPETKIHFIAHSMGNLVVLQALEKLALKTREGERPYIGEVILAHPDVDSDRFRQLLKYARPLKAGFTLYSSSDDKALWFSKLFRGVKRAGSQAVLVPGLQSIDISGLGSSIFGLNHSIFAKNPIVFGDIKKLLQTGQRPPHKRTKFFEMVKTKLGNYWRYKDAGE